MFIKPAADTVPAETEQGNSFCSLWFCNSVKLREAGKQGKREL